VKIAQGIKILLPLVSLVLLSAPAVAQSGFYVGGTVATESAERGSMDLRTFPAAGGLVGWRFSDAWSMEFHLDRGFAEGEPHGRLSPRQGSIVSQLKSRGYQTSGGRMSPPSTGSRTLETGMDWKFAKSRLMRELSRSGTAFR
jgi:hypothetical protein